MTEVLFRSLPRILLLLVVVPFALIGLRDTIVRSTKLLPIHPGGDEANYSTSTVSIDVTETKETIPHNSWCPAACASANDTSTVDARNVSIPEPPACNLCDSKFLIVLALGRTGSTTLTWMLDSLPGIHMGGENNGAINKLKSMIQTTAWDPHFVENEGATFTPWAHEKVEPGNLYCIAQEYMKALYPSNTTTYPLPEVIGFKTVRFLEGHDASKDAAFVQFLKYVFPCARFVINVRSDIDALIKSQKKAFGGRPGLGDKLRQELERMEAVAQLLPERMVYRLDSTQWTQNVSYINDLVRWLGFDAACEFSHLLELNTVRDYFNGNTMVEHRGGAACEYIGTDRRG